MSSKLASTRRWSRSSRAFHHYRFSVERSTIYFMVRLCVEALPDGGLKVSGLFGEEPVIWEEETSRRSFADANPPRLKFTLISKNDRIETSFKKGMIQVSCRLRERGCILVPCKKEQEKRQERSELYFVPSLGE